MNKPHKHNVNKAVDSIQERLTSYACSLNYEDLSPEAIHAAKVRIIDTLGAVIAGFFAEPCRIVRDLAAKVPDPNGATIIGTRMRTTPDMAALVNATTARFPETTDSYHWHESPFGGHASDALTPVLAAAEHAQINGRDFITNIVLAYEVFCHVSDAFHNRNFDTTNFACVATAVAVAKLLGLSPTQLSHAISMAVVPNNILRQVRTDQISMFKAVAAGQAGRTGVFAALLARAGMEGPDLPFEGKAGWCEHVALNRFSINAMGGNGIPFKIGYTQIKNRPSAGKTISSIQAAEKVGPLRSTKQVKQITVEVFKKANESHATGEHRWNPDSREGADHSLPYVIAAALMDGAVTLRSFNDAHLWNPELRALMQKVIVVENDEFTQAYDRVPQEHRARVTVVTDSGERLVGEAGGDEDDMGAPTSDAKIEEKFRGLTEDILSAKQIKTILDCLWHLESIQNVAEIPRAFIFD